MDNFNFENAVTDLLDMFADLGNCKRYCCTGKRLD